MLSQANLTWKAFGACFLMQSCLNMVIWHELCRSGHCHLPCGGVSSVQVHLNHALQAQNAGLCCLHVGLHIQSASML